MRVDQTAYTEDGMFAHTFRGGGGGGGEEEEEECSECLASASLLCVAGYWNLFTVFKSVSIEDMDHRQPKVDRSLTHRNASNVYLLYR
jgi:hypothetical protein